MGHKNFKKVFCICLSLLFVMGGLCLQPTSKVYALDNEVVVEAGTKENPAEIATIIHGLKANQKLILKEGYYQISEQAYVFEDNITIQGAGMDKTFINAVSMDQPWGITVHGRNNDSIVKNAVLKDFTISSIVNNKNGIDSVKAWNAEDLQITRVKTIGGNYGFDLNPVQNAIVDQCVIQDSAKAGIGVGAVGKDSDVIITNTTIEKSGWGVDVTINSSTNYLNSTVTIGKGNLFKNGKLKLDDEEKCSFVFEHGDFPEYSFISKQDDKTQKMVRLYSEIPNIILSDENVSLEKGKTKTLSTKLTPTLLSETVTWTSSDESIATVDKDGKVTAISKGETTIRATAKETTKDCIVTVYELEQPLVPSVDTTKPVEEVTAGINHEESKVVITETTSQIIEDLMKGQDIDESVISGETADKIKEAIIDGKSISTKVESQLIDKEMIDKKTIEKVEEILKDFEDSNEGTSMIVAQYLDLGIALETEDGKLGNINKLDKAIQFTITIPEDLKEEGRVYYVVRIHDGETTLLKTKVNDDGTLSFETDCFSTYALVYAEKEETPVSPNDPSTEQPKQEDKPIQSGGVKTSDTTSINSLLIIMGFALLVGVRSCVKRREYK